MQGHYSNNKRQGITRNKTVVSGRLSVELYAQAECVTTHTQFEMHCL